jgi:phage gp45-like
MKIGTFIARITGREIKKNRGGENPVRLLQAEVTSKDDTQTIEQLRQAGIDSGPVDDSRLFGFSLGGSAWKIAFAVDDGITPEAVPGELILYSQDAGAKASIIHLKTDGSIEITAPSDVNITGNLNVTGDVVADSAITGISLINHYHQGNLGYPTGTSLMTGGGATPGTPPTTNSSGDIIDGGGTNLSTHTHTQGVDSRGDSEAPTSGPL